MEKKKFADMPKKSFLIIQLALMLPTPFIFCFFAGHSLPKTVLAGLIDIGASLLTLILLIPIILICMVFLKLIFYGSVMGTERRVSLNVKHFLSFLFFLVATPPMAIFQAETFLWITGRAGSEDLSQALFNGAIFFLSGAAGIILSLKDLRDKLALIKRIEA